MKNIALLILILMVIASCNNKTAESKVAENSINFSKESCLMNFGKQYLDVPIRKLSIDKMIIRTDDKLPIELDFCDSSLYVVMAKSDTSIYVFDTKNGELQAALGLVGHGPEDVISPSFIGNNYDYRKEAGGLLYYDLNSKMILQTTKSHHLKKIMPYPENMYPGSSLNITKDYLVGKKIGRDFNKMFFVYDVKNKKLNEIDFSPVINNEDLDKIDKNYLYSANIGCNQKKNRIILGMYFFDMIHIYNMQGKQLKSISLSKGYDPEEALKQRINGYGYIGCPRIYATENYCYVRRDLVDEKKSDKFECQIIKLDWDGNLVSIYQIKENLKYGFCVNENNNTLYCISQIIDSLTNNEYYDIVSYKIS